MRFLDRFKPEEPMEEGEEYIELDFGDEKPLRHLLIQVEKVMDYGDSDRVLKKLREGHIIFVKVRDLREKSVSDLKRVIEKFKKTSAAINGDIAGVGEDWLILTPHYAKVHRTHE